MGAAKKHPLEEVFANYDRARFEYMIRDAAAISRNDPEVIKAMESVLDDPISYLKKNRDNFEERGIGLFDSYLPQYIEASELLDILMIDELAKRFYVVEIDEKCDIDDFFEALEEIETYDLIADAMPSIKNELDADEGVSSWYARINELLDDKACIAHLDINTNSYPFAIVTRETYELLVEDNGGDEDEEDDNEDDNDGNEQPVRNVIDDRDLKMQLADTALGLLVQGEDFGELANTRVEFGYLYYFDDHGIEALFKLETDKIIAYFAAQGDKLMRLNFTEELFRSTIEGFLEIHGED